MRSKRFVGVVWLSVVTASLAGCAAGGGPGSATATGGSVFGSLQTCGDTGFFCGMHTFPYSTLLKPGHIYTTLGNTKGRPVFGARVDEICELDTAAIKAKFPEAFAERVIERESQVTKTVGSNADLSLETVQLPGVAVGGSGKVVRSISYDFRNVRSTRVTSVATERVRANIGAECRQVIARYKKIGRFVFVAREIYTPEQATVSAVFNPSVGGTVKAKIMKGIAPSVTARFGRNRSETRAAANRVVEVVPSGL